MNIFYQAIYYRIVLTSVYDKMVIVLEDTKFVFTKKKLKSGEVFWRCNYKTCRTKVWTLGPDCRDDVVSLAAPILLPLYVIMHT